MDWVKHFDYIGTLLYATGLTMFLLGLSWGGSTYSWKSAQVLSFILIGVGCLVAFVLWELYAPLREPLVPLSLFKNRHWVISAALTGIGAGVYYSGASKFATWNHSYSNINFAQSSGRNWRRTSTPRAT